MLWNFNLQIHLTIGLPSESAPSIRTCIDSSPSSPPSKSSLASLIYMSISDSRASLSSSLKCSIQSIPSSVLPDSKYVRNPPIPISDTHSFLFLSSAIRILPFGPASHIHTQLSPLPIDVYQPNHPPPSSILCPLI